MNDKSISSFIWGSTFLVFLLPMLQWGSDLGWDINEISLLKIFPLLGLWAFAQMWLHYGVGSIKRRKPEAFDYKGWYKATGNVVFVLFMLHPMLLVFETVKVHMTPFDYVDDSAMIFLLLGYFGLASFLLYEVAEKFQGKDFWKKHFDKIKVLSIVAMLAIFAHSLQLGQNLEEGWLRAVWLVMFVAFVGFVLDSYTYKSLDKKI